MRVLSLHFRAGSADHCPAGIFCFGIFFLVVATMWSVCLATISPWLCRKILTFENRKRALENHLFETAKGGNRSEK